MLEFPVNRIRALNFTRRELKNKIREKCISIRFYLYGFEYHLPGKVKRIYLTNEMLFNKKGAPNWFKKKHYRYGKGFSGSVYWEILRINAENHKLDKWK